MKAGTRRLRRYMNVMGRDYGELWLWSQNAAGNYSFRLGAVPKPGAKRKWLKF